MENTMVPRLFTIDEAMKALRLSRGAVYRLMDSGRLPVVRTGNRRIYFRECDLVAVTTPGPRMPHKGAAPEPQTRGPAA